MKGRGATWCSRQGTRGRTGSRGSSTPSAGATGMFWVDRDNATRVGESMCAVQVAERRPGLHRQGDGPAGWHWGERAVSGGASQGSAPGPVVLWPHGNLACNRRGRVVRLQVLMKAALGPSQGSVLKGGSNKGRNPQLLLSGENKDRGAQNRLVSERGTDEAGMRPLTPRPAMRKPKVPPFVPPTRQWKSTRLPSL
ncbi:hypothetical protein HPB48_023853 [Haemaphysalis longicornis]|uniref:Uncharacterized protein n=1 Tax=Haemaphysalis longicornis TaxID=44386 RepID=A0A9J6H5X9_HAELO|nr:hypothetical protein HPB48_023853 [Haemaphysalis longicornis]